MARSATSATTDVMSRSEGCRGPETGCRSPDTRTRLVSRNPLSRVWALVSGIPSMTFDRFRRAELQNVVAELHFLHDFNYVLQSRAVPPHTSTRPNSDAVVVRPDRKLRVFAES